MSNIHDDYLQLKALREDRILKRREEDQALSVAMELIRERILSGESTGNRIFDFLLSRFGFLEPVMVEFYRDLEKKISTHAGELILLVKHHRKSLFQAELDSSGMVYDEVKYQLGKLCGGGLVFAGRERAFHPCDAPTGSFVTALAEGGEIQVTAENLMLPISYDSGNGCECLFQDINGRCELFIGNEEVRQYFDEQVNFHIKPHLLLYRMAKVLGWSEADSLPGRAMLVAELTEKLTQCQRAYIEALSSGKGTKTEQLGRVRVDFDRIVLEAGKYGIPTREACDLVSKTEALYNQP